MPDGHWEAIETWINSLSDADVCVVCGAHSPIEKRVFYDLLERKIDLIWMTASHTPDYIDERMMQAINENRLLIITYCDETVHYISRASACARNEWIVNLAQTIVVGYCRPQGNISQLLQQKENVIYLTPTDALSTSDKSERSNGMPSTFFDLLSSSPSNDIFSRMKRYLSSFGKGKGSHEHE